MYRYAILHETACVPSFNGQETTISSADVSSELDLWKPTDDYGSDDWFRIKPPTVSEKDQELYRKVCDVAERGPICVPQESLELYSKYIKQWCE